jgi:hypothetical protein
MRLSFSWDGSDDELLDARQAAALLTVKASTFFLGRATSACLASDSARVTFVGRDPYCAKCAKSLDAEGVLGRTRSAHRRLDG